MQHDSHDNFSHAICRILVSNQSIKLSRKVLCLALKVFSLSTRWPLAPKVFRFGRRFISVLKKNQLLNGVHLCPGEFVFCFSMLHFSCHRPKDIPLQCKFYGRLCRRQNIVVDDRCWLVHTPRVYQMISLTWNLTSWPNSIFGTSGLVSSTSNNASQFWVLNQLVCILAETSPVAPRYLAHFDISGHRDIDVLFLCPYSIFDPLYHQAHCCVSQA